MSFHDSYQESISETVDEIIGSGVDPSSRTIFQMIKVFYVQSSIDIATDSFATDQLIDMLIMLRLQRLVWQAGGHEFTTPAQHEKFLKILKNLENDFNKIARRVFPQREIDLVNKMAEDWHKRNPNRQYVAFVRFSDIEDSKEKADLERTLSKGGLFSSISETKAEIEETRHLLEKALFVTHHMPILMQWHAQLFMFKALSTGEIQDTLNQTKRLTLSAERISSQIDSLPDDLHKLLTESSKPVSVMLTDLKETSDNLRFIVQTLQPLIEEDEGGKPIELERIEHMFELAVVNSRELVKITENLNKLSYDSAAADHLGKIFADQVSLVDQVLATRVEDLDRRLMNQRKIILDKVLLALVLFSISFPITFFLCYLFVRKHLINHEKKLADAVD